MLRCLNPSLRSSFRRLYCNNVGIKLLSTASVARQMTKENLTAERRKAIIQSEPYFESSCYPSIADARQQYPDATLLRISDFRNRFETTDFSNYEYNRTSECYNIEGRISGIRKFGKAMFFFDLVQDNCKLQVLISNSLVVLEKSEFDRVHSWFKEGDYVSCHGFASRTKTGELTLKVNTPVRMLSPCLIQLPDKLIDKGIINQNRVMNYLVNPKSANPIIVKSQVIQAIRQFFINKGFLEMQTPILSSLGTGANAQPFLTKFKDDHVQLRVAPELWLKKMVIAGFEKIFEIGNNFRNEGIDQSHNPEFTSCEFYQSFTSLEELMNITEELLKQIFHKFKVPLGGTEQTKVSLKSIKFPKYDFLPTLEEITGKKINDLSLDSLLTLYKELGITVPSNPNPISLVNNLSETYLESLSVTKHYNVPVIIYNQPEILSPLAKSKTDGHNGIPVSLRFELFINGKEYVNAYEEENNPKIQLAKFQQQKANKQKYGDNEMLIPDWEYVKTMEMGLPPTGGWGIGIDRLAMYVSGAERIDEVLPFGNLRDVLKQ
ncbi:mitochondrial lysine-tRNA synthetase [Lodderomyces elongisporus]|uniref:Lysyl-tRNA synthetase n=1 Tax=Lodderomyces elongisporus (strain ATCC 11503 / CBS 2605 / JCM 1781 / NBRC 1676 / NRRL YB-4239) TaxID=379508 RepID=A5E5W3_LODEL|nr:mitochondrial lysine-tRNA synthetase [Lodderomyces elongisporus]EDK46821.1 hypothetical protein LELG_05002 [Lodderomyces elongisporus NRRL YB-4239]WLF81342.1 mitochondrial lysine-tRNA synthetase [Lodderomyces elongisporus]